MINRLNRSHFSIVPPEVAKEIEKVKAEVKAGENASNETETDPEDDLEDEDSGEEMPESVFGIGVEVRIVDNQVVITQVQKGSAAEKAGLRTGFVVEKVNDVLFSEFIAKIKNFGAFAKSVEKQLPLEIVSWFFNSRQPSEIRLAVLDESQTPKHFVFKREKLNGDLEKLVPNLPKQFLQIEARSIDDKIGYIKFNYFTVSMIEKFCSAISEFKDKKLLIIDLRGNLGGSYGSVIGLGGFFTPSYMPLGTEITKFGPAVRMIKPHKKNFKGNVVILVDKLSYSAAEIFAAGLQENARAVVIGEKSAGEALPSVTKTLPTGAVFLYPIANFKSPKGNLLEGNGVVPNISVSLKRESLLHNKDDQLDRAISFYNDKINNSNRLVDNDEISGGPELPPPPKPAPRAISALVGKVAKAPEPERIVQEENALKIIDDSVAAMGGAEAFRKITSYRAFGNAKLVEAGTEMNGKIEIYRQSPDKWAETLNIPGIGEFREVFDGKKYFVQSKVFGTDQSQNVAQTKEVELLADFYELLNVRKIFPGILFKGEYERKGKQVNLVEAKDKSGGQVIFVFDVESKMLVNRTGSSSVVSFSDYRKVGDILYPFWQSRTDALIYKFTDVKLNEKIDSKVFEFAESCFDRVD
jgi:carboxyl-terminal processing protease